ncbi:hypothetical protein LJC15_01190, partial [Desulfovibrio sp. OttesenSCG-928-G11]|nr:hypothetical protein [Desulfovibrio sp. OttesenSCG-928-G11]
MIGKLPANSRSFVLPWQKNLALICKKRLLTLVSDESRHACGKLYLNRERLWSMQRMRARGPQQAVS